MVPADPLYKHQDWKGVEYDCLRYALDKNVLNVAEETTETKFWRDTVFQYLRNKYPTENVQIQLYWSLPGFQLFPHTDFRNKKETTVYYLTDKEIPDIGTAIFKPTQFLEDPDGNLFCVVQK